MSHIQYSAHGLVVMALALYNNTPSPSEEAHHAHQPQANRHFPVVEPTLICMHVSNHSQR